MNMTITARDILPRHANSFFYLKSRSKSLEVLLRFLHLQSNPRESQSMLLKLAQLTVVLGMDNRDAARANASSAAWMNLMSFDGLVNSLQFKDRKATGQVKSDCHQLMIEHFENIKFDPLDTAQVGSEVSLQIHGFLLMLIKEAMDQIEFLEGIGFDVVYPGFNVHDLQIKKTTLVVSEEESHDVYFVSMLPSHPDLKVILNILHRSEPALVVMSSLWEIEQWRRNCCSTDADLLKMVSKVVPDENGNRTLVFV